MVVLSVAQLVAMLVERLVVELVDRWAARMEFVLVERLVGNSELC
jgi:hypothetical protein